MDSRRILITALSSPLGGRLAQALEREPQVESVVGVDAREPRLQLERTEFVRVEPGNALIRRIVNAAVIDTVIDTRLEPDPPGARVSAARAGKLAGTRAILDACAAIGSPVRKLVVSSSAVCYGSERDDPAFFTEAMRRAKPPRSGAERELLAHEAALADFAALHPAVVLTVLRLSHTIGAELSSAYSALLGLPAIPAILGFDPRCQLLHEEDAVGALVHAARRRVPGTYNVAADGVLALSEIASLLGKPLLPLLPPWGAGFAAEQLRRLGLAVPVQALRELRFGRGLDNRRLKATGYAYRHTTREALLELRAQQRLRPLLRSPGESYRYEREVEEFLRWSPSVRTALTSPEEGPAEASNGRPAPPYDELSEDEVIAAATSLQAASLAQLRRYEAAHRARPAVLDALDRGLRRAPTPAPRSSPPTRGI